MWKRFCHEETTIHSEVFPVSQQPQVAKSKFKMQHCFDVVQVGLMIWSVISLAAGSMCVGEVAEVQRLWFQSCAHCLWAYLNSRTHVSMSTHDLFFANKRKYSFMIPTVGKFTTSPSPHAPFIILTQLPLLSYLFSSCYCLFCSWFPYIFFLPFPVRTGKPLRTNSRGLSIQ